MISVYKIGVELSAKNGVSPVLRLIARDMLGMGKQADLLTGKMNGLKFAAIGTGIALAGVGVLKGTAGLIRYGDKVAEVQAKMRQLHMTSATIAKDTKAAFAASMKYPAVSYSGALDATILGRETLGSSKVARRAENGLVRNIAEMINLPTIFSNPLNDMHGMLRSADTTGADLGKNGHFSAAALASFNREFMAAIITSQGLVTPSMMSHAYKQMGPMARLYDQRTFTPVLGELLGSQGIRGARGMASDTKELTGGTLAKNYATNMASLHLLKHGMASIQSVKGGSYDSIKPGQIVHERLLFSDLPKWIATVYTPALRAANFKTKNQQIAAGNLIWNSKPGAAAVGMMIANPEGVQRAEKQQHAQEKVSLYKSQMATSLNANLKALRGSFVSFAELAGLPLIPKAIKIVNEVTASVVKMEKWANVHPAMVKRIVEGMAEVGGALVFLGSGMVAGALISLAGPEGLLVAAGASILAVHSALSLDWPKLTRGFDGASVAVSNLGGDIRKFTAWTIEAGKIISGADHGVQTAGKWFYNHVTKPIEGAGGRAVRGGVRLIVPGLPHGRNMGLAAGASWASNGAAVPPPRKATSANGIDHATIAALASQIGHAVTHGLRHGTNAPPSSTTGHNGRMGAQYPGVGSL